MRLRRLQPILLVIAAISLLLTSTAAAQTPPAAPAPNPALGSSGLSFRYAGQLGYTEEPYFPSTSLINRPRGLYLNPATQDVYVTEEVGGRVLRYDSTGKNTLVLGTAGVTYRGDYTFDNPSDVSVDKAGNVWVADWSRIVQYSPAGVYQQDVPSERPWETGQANGRFDQTYGIAFDKLNHMYVSDRNNHRVQVFIYDPSSGTAPVWHKNLGVTQETGSDNLHFNNPGRLAVDSLNNLYVVDQGNRRVQKCAYTANTDTWTCAPLPLPAPVSEQLEGVTVDKNGAVYIAGMGGKAYKCVQNTCQVLTQELWTYDLVVDANLDIYASRPWECLVEQFDATLAFKKIWKGELYQCYTTDVWHYFSPRVHFDAQDNLIIVENAGQRVIKAKRDGTPLWTFGTPGHDEDWNTDHLGWPSRAATDAAGNVYIADSNRIMILDGSTGAFKAKLGDGSGGGDYGFSGTRGVALDSKDRIYVADQNNHRVMIYSSLASGMKKIGMLGTGGCDPVGSFLCGPGDIVVDKTGNIFVLDTWSNRVVQFNSSYQIVKTLGKAYEGGDPNNNFLIGWPEEIALDAFGRLYVAGAWTQRVKVYDTTGAEFAYLAAIGGQYGGNTQEFRSSTSVAVDRGGRVYIGDQTNARIQMYDPGPPTGWLQKSLNGFGYGDNNEITRLTVHNGALYASTDVGGSERGAEVWRTDNGRDWYPVATGGLGDTGNYRFQVGESIGGWLYLSGFNDAGAQLWRCQVCAGSDWSQVLSSAEAQGRNQIQTILKQGDAILISLEGTGGTLFMRSPGGAKGTWSIALNQPGFGNPQNSGSWSAARFGSYLYTGTAQWGAWPDWDQTTGLDIWRCQVCDGSDWEKVTGAAMHRPGNFAGSMVAINNTFYLGTANPVSGAEVWSCQACDGTDWTQINTPGFNSSMYYTSTLMTFKGKLYALVDSWHDGEENGMQIFAYNGGTSWTSLNINGFGDAYTGNAFAWAVFQDSLYLGGRNYNLGGQVWQMLDRRSFLPALAR